MRLFLIAVALLSIVVLASLLTRQDSGYAAPPAAPAADHRPTKTPTPTPTADGAALQTASSEDVGLDPFLGFDSVPTQVQWLEFCANAVVSEEGEAWVVSDTSFVIGEPGVFTQPTLYVQRCVGQFQPWFELDGTATPEAFVPVQPGTFLEAEPLPVAPEIFSLQPSAALPDLDLDLELRMTPEPDRPPVLAPVFPTALPPIVIPTLESFDDFTTLPQARVSLRTPSGDVVPLDPAGDRPDLWFHTFDLTSETGTYTLIIETEGEKQERTINVYGNARIYFTDRRSGALTREFADVSDAAINYVDFREGGDVAVSLYRIVDLPSAMDVYTQDALALIDRWTFTPTDQPRRESLADRLRVLQGAPFGNFILLVCYVAECNQLPRIQITSRRVVWPEVVMGDVRVLADPAQLRLPDEFQTIRFAPGGTETTVGLTLSDTGVEGYMLGIGAGQEMTVSFDSADVQAYVLDPRGDLLSPSQAGVGTRVFAIPETGRYVLLVYGDEDAHMTVRIPPR